MSIKIVLKMVLLSVVLLATSAHSMNKAELIDAIAKDASLSKADAKRALEAILDSSLHTYFKKKSTVLLPFGKIKHKQISRQFSANGHITVLKRNESPVDFNGHVTVLKSADTGDLELIISKLNSQPIDLDGDNRLDLVLVQTKLKITGKSKRPGIENLAVTFLHNGNHYSAVVKPTSLARGWDGTYKGHVTVLKLAKPTHEYVGHVTLLRGLATTAYADSFFDVFSPSLALIIETRLSNTLYSYEDNHNRLYNLATYAQILADYLNESSPLLMSYVHCVSVDGIDDDCGSIRKELHRLLQEPITLMREQTKLDPDSDGDTISDASSKFEFTVLPDRVELLIRETTTRALDVYLNKIAEEIINAEKQGQNNETDFAFILRKAAKMSGIEKAVIKKVSDSFNDISTNALKKGDTVSIVGFGSFSVSQRAARVGRNPQTGKAIQISAKKVVKFKAGADLSKKVN